MPDGTRGFTMGRGRPLLLQKSEKVEEWSYWKTPGGNLTEDLTKKSVVKSNWRTLSIY
jgi:hypothetical protein